MKRKTVFGWAALILRDKRPSQTSRRVYSASSLLRRRVAQAGARQAAGARDAPVSLRRSWRAGVDTAFRIPLATTRAANNLTAYF